MSSVGQFVKAPITRITLADAVYETLLEAIISGRLKPETVLSEVAIAKELEVSRTPVHEALRQLAKDGLVVQEVNRKARVASFSRNDVHEIFEMRKLLEGKAAELAAGQISEEDLARLRSGAEQLAASRDGVDWVERWIDHDQEFHDTIGRAGGNGRLWQDIARYRLLHRGFNRLATNVDCLQTALQEHQAILAALAARESGTASLLMVAHITAWQDFFVRNFPR